MLRIILGPKKEEVAGGWRRLHNEELHNLNGSPDIIRVIKSRGMIMGGACNTHGRYEKCMRYFGWETRREETTNIRMNLRVGGC